MAQLIELYEHQRYSFNGWSGDSLLPYVDPYAFTSINTNKSIPEGWNTVIEANVSLLSTGWNWISSDNFWIPNVTSNTDAEGWIYAVNFSFIDEGVAIKGSLHFARRRTLQRHRDFHVASVLDINTVSDCYCDSEEVDRVALQLLTALSAASHHRHPNQVTFSQMNTLKSEFAHLLFLEGYVLNMTRDTVHDATLDTHSDLSVAPLLFSTSTSNDNKSNSKNDILIHTSSSGGTIEDGSHNKKRTPWQSIAYKIDQFARNDKSVWFTGLQSDDNVEALICRTVEVADHYFMYHERSEFAKLMIRCHDMDFRYHCNRPASSHSQSVSTDVGSNISRPPLCTLENCIFAPYNCVNQDCPVAISRKWREKHDLSCMNKAVSCQRSCGDKVMRKLTHIHLATECRLRPVKCPFNDIGCNEELVQAAVPAHLTDHVSNHLTLAVRRIHEQQQDIKSQSTQIDALTNQFQQQLQLADVVQNGMTTVHALVEASEHRQKSVLDEAITKHHIITTRKLNEINSTFHLELNKLTRSVADLNIQINEIRSLVSK